jgi:hypothetical protein
LRRRGIDQERDEQVVGLGGIQRAPEGAPGGGLVAERVAGDRLQQRSRHHEHLADLGDRTVQDGREYARRRLRVVLGEPR